MKNNKLYIIEDPVYGYKRLEPIPSEDELFEFYQSHYYSLILKGQRAPHLRRLLAGEGEKDRELSWLSSSLYMDILTILEQQNHFHPKRLLDLGCGTGDFLAFMKKYGWEVAGIELSSDATVMARGKDLEVYNLSINDFLANYPQFLSTFGVVSLMNLLEHSPKPVEVLNIAKQLLVDNGIVLVIVPNDFNALQLAAQKHLKKDPWWVAIPDHINYFDFKSLSTLLKRLGFEVIYSQTDFPMELFLLMGDDYVGNKEIGNKCHQKRVNFEMAVPGELRRRIYQALVRLA